MVHYDNKYVSKYLKGFETDRLVMKKVEYMDVKSWQSFFSNNPLLDYLNFERAATPKKMAVIWIENQLKRYLKDEFGHLTLLHKDTTAFIGQCGIINRNVDGKHVLEIAYSILQSEWGKGYAQEASKVLIDFAFANNIAKSLVSIIHVDNIPSQKVAEKNGMTKKSREKQPDRDVYIFEITFDSWIKGKKEFTTTVKSFSYDMVE